MKLGLFSRYFHTAYRRGIAIYTKELTVALAGLIMQHDVTLIDYFWNRKAVSNFPEFSNSRFNKGVIRLPGRLFQRFNSTFQWPKADSFHGPFDMLHLLHEFSAPCSSHPNLAVTVHGIGPVLHPAHFPKSFLSKWRADLDRSIEAASQVIAVSDSLARQLCRYRPKFSDKITSTPLGVADDFFAVSDQVRDDHIQSQLTIDAPYILYVGAFDSGKNISVLLKAYSLYVNESGSNDRLELVLVGNSRWGGYEALKQESHRLNIASKTHFVDYIDHSLLPVLYRRCVLFVFPSLFEGFGLPVLEAMACGAPCLVSDRPALDEIGKEAALFFDPTSPEDLAAKISRTVENEELRTTMSRNGRRHAKKYTWRNTALETIRIYERMLGVELISRVNE